MTQINILMDCRDELNRVGVEIAGSGAVAKVAVDVDQQLALLWLKLKPIVLKKKVLDDEEVAYMEHTLARWRDESLASRIPVRDTIDYLDQRRGDATNYGLREFLGRSRKKPPS